MKSLKELAAEVRLRVEKHAYTGEKELLDLIDSAEEVAGWRGSITGCVCNKPGMRCSGKGGTCQRATFLICANPKPSLLEAAKAIVNDATLVFNDRSTEDAYAIREGVLNQLKAALAAEEEK